MEGPVLDMGPVEELTPVVGLRWEDLDFTHRTLYVRCNLVMG